MCPSLVKRYKLAPSDKTATANYPHYVSLARTRTRIRLLSRVRIKMKLTFRLNFDPKPANLMQLRQRENDCQSPRRLRVGNRILSLSNAQYCSLSRAFTWSKSWNSLSEKRA